MVQEEKNQQTAEGTQTLKRLKLLVSATKVFWQLDMKLVL